LNSELGVLFTKTFDILNTRNCYGISDLGLTLQQFEFLSLNRTEINQNFQCEMGRSSSTLSVPVMLRQNNAGVGILFFTIMKLLLFHDYIFYMTCP
jgi:hypothetical protein